MRILCINLQKIAEPSLSEAFLRFSSKVEMREQKSNDGGSSSLIFIDITATAHLFEGEDNLLEKALILARRYHPHATAAISDHPATAQVFANYFSSILCPPGKEKDKLAEMPLTALCFFEGLKPWEKVSEINHVISLFQILGLQSIGELYPLKVEAFRERWGKLGELLWKRLHKMDSQELSPLCPDEPLKYYTHLDEPLSLLSFLLYYTEKGMTSLVDRMQGRGLYAQKVTLNLTCEYSEKNHQTEISLTPASRDLKLLMELLERKLGDINLENPIREFEIEVSAVPENIQQIDFFTPQVSDQEKLQKISYLFQQISVRSGFLQLKNSIFPERSFTVTQQPKKHQANDHVFEREDEGLKKLPAYGAFPKNLPRPTRLLKKPQPLSKYKIRQFQNVLPMSKERLEEKWWTSNDLDPETRDYHFALSQKGQLMWIFKNHKNQQYYLHGYCD